MTMMSSSSLNWCALELVCNTITSHPHPLPLLDIITRTLRSSPLRSRASRMEFNYKNQAAWGDLPGSFSSTGKRQSPINIIPADVQENSSLLPNLIFNGWDGTTNGTLSNTSHSIQFDPKTKSVTTVNHKGTYTLQQFHFHWGEGQCNGSEHRIEGSQCDAEIHFVHHKQGVAMGSMSSDSLTVIAVLGKADDAAPFTGIWQQLVVPTAYKGSFGISGLHYSDLLPSKRDYYYYEGSLTTPLCNEIVQWFVLKEPIRIPTVYLQTLRSIQENAHGHPLTHNVRDVQPLNGRIVTTPSSV